MSRQQLLSSEDSPLYLRICELIKNWIHDGTYRPGVKLPSVRKLSDQLDVSISTVLLSYDILEKQGFVEVRTKSGYYVKTRENAENNLTKTSRPNSSPRFIQSHDAYLDVIRSCGASDIVQLGSAKIDSSLLPTDSLARSMSSVLKHSAHQAINYDLIVGDWNLRREIARRSMESGLKITPDSVLTSTGCMEAIHLALRATTKAGDIVAVESPTYYGILQALHSSGLKVLELPTSAITGIDLDFFEEKLKKINVKAAIVSPSFQNPLGFEMSEESKLKLLRLCEKHNIALIEDDIYSELNFEGQRPTAIKSFDKKDQVFLCSSFSKTLAPGFRVGWLVPPKKYFEEVERIKFSFTIATNTAAQMAIADYLEKHNYDRYLRRLRQILSENMHRTRETVCDSFPQGTRMTQPRGGCLLWVELPSHLDTFQLQSMALKEGISIIPGGLFSSTGMKYQNYIRLNCGTAWSEKLSLGLRRVGELAKTL